LYNNANGTGAPFNSKCVIIESWTYYLKQIRSLISVNASSRRDVMDFLFFMSHRFFSRINQQQDRLPHVNVGLGIRAPPAHSASLKNH